MNLLSKVNVTVNRDIRFMLDRVQYQQEEFWAYPHSGSGDCEDVAIEKRSRLVQLWLPRGALRMAIGFHKKTLTAHAMLLIETSQGTYVLSNCTSEIVLWHESPYNFEMRERPDGKWERFDQTLWTFE